MANRTVANLTTVLQMNNSKFKKGLTGSQKALKAFQNQVKAIGGMMASAFAVTSVIAFGKSVFQALDTQRKAETKVATAIISTGKAAGFAADELKEVAKQLQKITLFGDEEILGGVTAQLLTFTNIANDEFKRTQQAVLDIATVLGQDLKSTAIQVGKALNDPVANLGALGRSGIQFEKTQKDLIKSLWEVGNRAEAQRIILVELERQYGNQARAAAEVDISLTQLKNKFGDVKESIARFLIGQTDTDKELRKFADKSLWLWTGFLEDGLLDVESASNRMNKSLAISNGELEKIKSTSEYGLDITNLFPTDTDMGFLTSGLWGMSMAIGDLATNAAKLPTILAVENWELPPGFEDAWSGDTMVQNMNFDRDPELSTPSPIIGQSMELLLALNDMGAALDETIEGWVEGWDKAFGAETFDKVDKVSTGIEELGASVGVMLVSQFDSLGEAIGKMASGAEDSFRDLGEAIMANLGNILIMVGASMGPAGIPFIIGGAALQLGSGFLRGFGGKTDSITKGNSYSGATVNFRISGNDLVGAMDRQNYSNSMNT